MKTNYLHWEGHLLPESIRLLMNPSGVIVSPTKVGYIIMATDEPGLQRKFSAKQRSLSKPGVVLCSSIDQLVELAELNEEIITFYQTLWDKEVLLGCILPWKSTGRRYIPKDGTEKKIMDHRGTSCFVIKFGTPSEQITEYLWQEKRKLVFASSANPSGQGNRGVVKGIGKRIEEAVDLIISADSYVQSIQPEKNEHTRYEQGVMVSMVDEQGNLIPEQKGKRDLKVVPSLIRKGLNLNEIMSSLSEQFLSWDFRHGHYY